MKNKWMALLLAGVMAFSGAVTVCAEETTDSVNAAAEDTTESGTDPAEADGEEVHFITLSQDGIDENTYVGYWEDFEPGFSLFLPLDWENPEIDEESAEKGIFYQSAAKDSSAIVSLQANAAGSADITEIAASMEEAGFTSVQLFDVNGIYAVGYDDTANDLSGLSFLGETGTMYTILVTPVSVLEYQPIFLNVFQSLRPTDDPEEE